jgi:predicted MFS family arabinose efflux permease
LISGVWGVLALGAPLLGGMITDTLGWRWIFLVNVPLCALVLLLAWWAIARSSPSAGGPRRSLPILRSVLLAVAVGGLTAAPSARSEASVALLGIGVLAAVVFAVQERRAAVPIIPLDTWRGRGPLGSSMLATLFYTGAYVGAGVFLPLYLVEIRGESTTHAGLVLSVGGSMWTVGSIIAASRGHGRWPMRMAIAGAVLISLACLSVAVQALVGNLPLPLIYIAWGAAGFGVGIAVLHLMNWAIVYSPAEQSGAISSAIQTMRMLGSAAVGALMGALLNAIGTAPGQLHLAIAAIFSLTAVIALWPATFGRPRIGQRAEHSVSD